MALKFNPAMKLTSSMDDEQLLAYLIVTSTGVSPATLISSVKALPTDLNTKKIGSLAVGASVSVKKVIDDVKAKAGIALPETWLVNGSINFSMLALLGHMIFLLPDEALTKAGLDARVKYRVKIGGAENMKAYTAANSVEGREMRNTILLKWANQLKGVDVMEYRGILAEKFPGLVMDERSLMGKVYDTMVDVAKKPFGWATGFFTSLWAFLKWHMWKILYFTLFVMVISFISKALLVNTVNTIAGFIGANVMDPAVEGYRALAVAMISKLPQIYFRTTSTVLGSYYGVVVYILRTLTNIREPLTGVITKAMTMKNAGELTIANVVTKENALMVAYFAKDTAFVMAFNTFVAAVFAATESTISTSLTIPDMGAYAAVRDAFLSDFPSLQAAIADAEEIVAAKAEVNADLAAQAAMIIDSDLDVDILSPDFGGMAVNEPVESPAAEEGVADTIAVTPTEKAEVEKAVTERDMAKKVTVSLAVEEVKAAVVPGEPAAEAVETMAAQTDAINSGVEVAVGEALLAVAVRNTMEAPADSPAIETFYKAEEL